LQLRQTPAAGSEQAVLQQTPSVQFPLRHCAPAEQLAPFDFLPQEPPLHVFVPVQSALVVQLLLHMPVAVSQVYTPQALEVAAGQAPPRPSQNAASSIVVAFEQLAGRH